MLTDIVKQGNREFNTDQIEWAIRDYQKFAEDNNSQYFFGYGYAARAINFLFENYKQIKMIAERYEAALDKLSKLGNGDKVGNSMGNDIASQALGIKEEEPCKPKT